jgi:hypothetical protein
MVDYKNALEQVGSRVSPNPDDLTRIGKLLHRRKARKRVGLATIALLIAGAAMSGIYIGFFRSHDARVGNSGRCESLIPECVMERLPDRTLTGDEHEGALGPIGQLPEGLISFDDALIRAWAEDGHAGAKSVQVVLGTADTSKIHWDSNSDYFYSISWSGTCEGSISRRPGGSYPPDTCPPEAQTWGTIIDAYTGAFIVGGSG